HAVIIASGEFILRSPQSEGTVIGQVHLREGRKFKQGRQRRSVTDYVNQPWRFKRVLDRRRIQDAGREDTDTLDTFDATDLGNIDPGKHTLCAPSSTDDSAAGRANGTF